MNAEIPSFAHLLWERAQRSPDQVGYTFLSQPKGELTYGDLHARAAAVAARLLAVASPGDRAVLLAPPGPDYVAGFLGCLYAGIIAVPAYPPLDDRQVPRLASVIGNARPAALLTPAGLAGLTREGLLRHGVDSIPVIVALDGAAAGPPPVTAAPRAGRGDVAFLQYTSGTVGEPKGAMISHGNLLDNSAAIKALFGHDEHSRGVIWLPPYHDMGLIGGILQPLYAGFPVALMSPLDFLAEPASWLAAISEYRATTSGGPNFAFDLCTAKVTDEQCAGLDLSSWSLAFCGAEPVRAASLARFAERFAPCGFSAGALFPCYGLAESTLIVSGGDKGSGVSRRGEVVSCGRAIPGHRITVHAPDGTEQADGEAGEVRVSGPSVSLGYWDSPEASRETFTTDQNGEHALRTGDLGSLRDGELYITGRAKDLIIVRGRNVAAADAEYAISDCHPQIRRGCVVAFGTDDGAGEELVVLAELRDYAAARPAEVRAAIQAALAAHLGVTARRVLLGRRGAVLKTPSGKIRRGECRSRFLAGELALLREDRGDPAQPGRSLVASLTELAGQVLGEAAGPIGPGTSLTGAGMDSLRAVELLHAARERLGLDLPLASLLGGATPGELAVVAPELPAAAAGAAPPGQEPPDTVTDGERALWVMSRLSGDQAHYVLTIAAELRAGADSAAVDAGLVGDVLHLLRRRHPALRTYFPEVAGQPARAPYTGALELAVADLAGQDAVEGWISEFEALGVDPARSAPWKAALLRPAGAPALLVLCVHHMICDLWSLDILAREFTAGYFALERGGLPAWAPAADPGRLAIRRNAELSGQAGERLADFWRAELSDAPPSGGLPSARGKRHGLAPAGRYQAHLPGALAAAIAALARRQQVTAYTVLLTSFAWLLHHYTGERRLILGIPAPGRLDPESATAVGYFVNPLPLVCEIDPAADFAVHLRATRDRLAAVMANQDYPYQRVLDHCGPSRGEPAIRVLLLQQQTPDEPAPPGRASLLATRLVRQRNAPFELTIEVSADGDGLACAVSYDAEALQAGDVQAAITHWTRLLDQVSTAPGILPGAVTVLSDADRRRVLQEWNAIESGPPGPATVHEAVLAAAARHPQALAVRDEHGALTYAELDQRSARLAALLAAHGAGPGAPVGLALPRSAGLVTAMLAAMRAGAPYVPLDVAHPRPRLTMIAADAAPAVIIASRHTRDALDIPPGASVLIEEDLDAAGLAGPAEPPASPAHPDWPAYIMYTSGSTGKPKGVVCGHRGVLNLLADSRLDGSAQPGDRCAWWTSPGFDVSVFEVFRALTAGATAEVCPPAARQHTAAFMDWAATAGITAAYLPPHLLADLPKWLRDNPGRAALRHLTVSVEPIPEPLLREIASLAPGLAITNGYGPTEATVFSTLYAVGQASDHDGITPMGRGVRNCPHYLLDALLRPVPPGMPGEVLIGGSGLAHGYLGSGALTASRFVPSPFLAGERLYRTGDLARYRPDGQLLFLGRLDHQVKVRGMRIEPREVEAVIARHPLVSTALVVAREAADGLRLIGYAQVPGERHDPGLAGEISRYAREQLPGPMVPRHIVLVTDWPMTVNGKIDRARLPRPDEEGHGYTPPAGPAEAAIAGLWAQLLGRERVGRDDDFFDLGGDSLLAVRCAVRLSEELGVQAEAVDLLNHPVVRQLAAELATRPGHAEPPATRQVLLDHVAALPADALELLGTRSGGAQR